MIPHLIEIICLAISFIIVWEAIYIWFIKKDILWENEWLGKKIGAFFATLGIYVVHIFLLGEVGNNSPFPFHYIRLVYEVIIITLITLFFYMNKKIYDHITYKVNSKGGK